MGFEKSEIKMAVAHDIGCHLEDMLEAAKSTVHRWEGSKHGHQQSCKGLDGLLGQITLDLKEGKLTMDEATLVQRWVQRARGMSENLALQSDVLILKAKGKVDGLESAVAVTKKRLDVETRKRDALLEPVATTDADVGRPTSRPTGRHPGVSEAQLRREEEKGPAKKPKKRKCGKCGESGHTARACKKPKKS